LENEIFKNGGIDGLPNGVQKISVNILHFPYGEQDRKDSYTSLMGGARGRADKADKHNTAEYLAQFVT
jgi:hypothetical protein